MKETWKNLRIYKIALGSSLAYLIADLLGLQYASSAAIVTLLTVLETRKATFDLAKKRYISFAVTMALAWLIYENLGYHVVSMGLVMMLMVGISYHFGWQLAISVNAVINTHFLMEQSYTLPFIMNELIMVTIGTVIALLMNSYMPKRIRHLREDIHEIENLFQKILNQIAEYLLRVDRKDYDGESIRKLEARLEKAVERAFENLDNTLDDHSRYYIEYMEMRKSQVNVLEAFHDSLHSLSQVRPEAKILADFFRDTAATFHERNNVEELLKEWEKMSEYMMDRPLPTTRDEFEDRAILYHMMMDMEEFLLIKKEFSDQMTPDQVRIYWERED